MSPFPDSQLAPNDVPFRLRPYKFQVLAVCQNIDAGTVVGESVIGGLNGEPIVVFGVNGLREFADAFEDRLQAAQDMTQSPSTNNA